MRWILRRMKTKTRTDDRQVLCMSWVACGPSTAAMAHTATTRAEAFDPLEESPADYARKCWGLPTETGEQQPVSWRGSPGPSSARPATAVSNNQCPGAAFISLPTGSTTSNTTMSRRFSRGCRSMIPTPNSTPTPLSSSWSLAFTSSGCTTIGSTKPPSVGTSTPSRRCATRSASSPHLTSQRCTRLGTTDLPRSTATAFETLSRRSFACPRARCVCS